ncbi:MAG: VCBS repeat-containing protein [Micropruina sp.]|nr:VCBS repeat-containing protein [Micropruina sp.]
MATGDLNGDGLVDLLLGTATNASLFLGTGPGAFNSTAAHTFTGGAVAAAIADLDNDGRRDVVLIRAGTSSAFRTTAATASTASFGTAVSLTTPLATSVAVGDVNGDGLADVVVGAQGVGAQTRVFANLGSTAGTWNGYAATAGTLLGADTATKAVALADLNNDGVLDLLAVTTAVAHSCMSMRVSARPGGTASRPVSRWPTPPTLAPWPPATSTPTASPTC